MSILDEINSENFRNFLVKEIIKTENINGTLIVPNDFILEIEASDPYEWLDIFMEKNHKYNELDISEKTKTELALHFININIKRIIKEEISKINNDVNSELKSYINILESFGFEKIYEKKHKIEREANCENPEKLIEKIKNNLDMQLIEIVDINGLTKIKYSLNECENFYYNERNGILCHFDTYENNINSIKVHLQGSIKDRESFNKLSTSNSYIMYSEDIYSISLDMKDMLSSKLEILSKIIKFSPNWKQFDLMLYSYLTKENKDSLISVTIDKLKEFPDNVLRNMFNNNSNYDSLTDDIENLVIKKSLNNNYFKVKEFIKGFNLDVSKDILIREILFDAKYSEKGVKLYLPQKIKEDCTEFGLDFSVLHKYGSIIKDKALSVINDKEPLYICTNDIQRIKSNIEKMNDSELEIISKIKDKNIINVINQVIKLKDKKITHKYNNTLQ